MRKLAAFFILLCLTATAHARLYDRAELEGLLAPVATYPDSMLMHVLIAASYPDQVKEAARGTPPQPHWHPSVSALQPYPDVLERMAESPQWMRDLAEAYVHQQADVMLAVQELRGRAQAYAHLPPAVAPAPVLYGAPPVVVYSAPLIVHHHHRVFPRFVHNHPHHSHPHHRVPEAQRRPIVSSTPQLFNKPRSAPQSRSAGIFHKPR